MSPGLNSRNTLRFDGTTDWLITPSAPPLTLTSTGTITATALLNRNHSDFSRLNNGTGDYRFFLSTNQGEWVSTFFGNGTWPSTGQNMSITWLNNWRTVSA